MDNFNRKKHWDDIYQNKNIEEASWHQSVPETSLNFVKQFQLSKTSKIIDVGGGESLFVDHLLSMGYKDITVLDISKKAIEKAKKRLGDKANAIKWIITDAMDFQPTHKFDLWHDRAAFHFLTDEKEIETYLRTANKSIEPTGHLVVGTFSLQGPKRCSGIDIHQYSGQTMASRLKNYFLRINCLQVDHQTPTGTLQNFTFCSFRPVYPN